MKNLLKEYQQAIVGGLAIIVTISSMLFALHTKLDARLDALESTDYGHTLAIESIHTDLADLKADLRIIQDLVSEERADIAALNAKVDDLKDFLVTTITD